MERPWASGKRRKAHTRGHTRPCALGRLPGASLCFSKSEKSLVSRGLRPAMPSSLTRRRRGTGAHAPGSQPRPGLTVCEDAGHRLPALSEALRGPEGLFSLLPLTPTLRPLCRAPRAGVPRRLVGDGSRYAQPRGCGFRGLGAKATVSARSA